MQHHAYYIEGPTADYDAYHAHFTPLYGKKYERFGIDEARRLVELSALKNYRASTFLIVAAVFPIEAQQTLLKLFEEPQEGTTFVVVVPPGVLMETLKSRMAPYPGRIETAKAAGAGVFLKSAGKGRSDIIAAMLKDEDDTKERVRAFVDALELELHKKIGDAKARQGLVDIAMVRDYLRDRSPSLKMLLEHLAVCLPQS